MASNNEQLTQSLVAVRTPKAATKPRGLLARTLAFGQSIAQKCIDGDLTVEAQNLASDVHEGLCAYWVSLVSPQQMQENYFSVFLFSEPFQDRKILKSTIVGSNKSCQRSILEVCALKMSNAERSQLLESIGSRFIYRDALYKEIREPVDLYWRKARLDDVYFNQRWYKVTERGSLLTVDALFRIIRANPHAFCQLLAC